VRTIKLMPDYRCWPLWHASGIEVGDIDPDTLPLSADLKARLQAWAEVYDNSLNWEDPASSTGLMGEELARFQQEGSQLARLLREELGSGYSVVVQF
jgi:hypothetical protein